MNRRSFVRSLLTAATAGATIANRADAAGLETAAAMGVATLLLPHRAYPSRDTFDAALSAALKARRPF